MRVRSLLTMSTGAAVGAGAMYLLDPERGVERRRDARRTALREIGRRGADIATRGARRAGQVAEAAVYGYHAERQTPSAHQ